MSAQRGQAKQFSPRLLRCCHTGFRAASAARHAVTSRSSPPPPAVLLIANAAWTHVYFPVAETSDRPHPVRNNEPEFSLDHWGLKLPMPGFVNENRQSMANSFHIY